ncbi:MAG: class I SAM-dependent DNA methyltransferase [bacterium]|jgi:2-polyprenyl-3-methyl-5-hydroxy-6-metoxy-1,4-benzoquinol methylase
MSEDIVRRNRTAYSRIAAEWEKRQTTAYDRAFHDRCRAEFLLHLKGNRVLDIGCGLGLDTEAFAAAGLRVVAADIVTEFLEIVKRRTSAASVVAVDMTALCFRAESFDGIYGLASFLHVPRDLAPAVLAGFARMLAPGGILFLHHVEAADGRTGYVVDDLLIKNNPALCFCHPREELTYMLAAAGLRVISQTDHRPDRYPSESAARYGLTPYQLIAARN